MPKPDIMKKVISESNLPSRIPFKTVLIYMLLLDRFGASGIVWGVVMTLVGLWFFGAAHKKSKENQVDTMNHEDIIEQINNIKQNPPPVVSCGTTYSPGRGFLKILFQSDLCVYLLDKLFGKMHEI